MKKRLLSLLVALCMLVTLLPVSALTAAAEEGSSSAKLEIAQGGYPEGSHSGSTSCSGNGWSYESSTETLTLSPSTPTNYDFSNNSIHTGWGSNTNCNIIIGQYATVTDGAFWGAVINHGKIVGGIFYSSVTNESDGIIENGQFGIDSPPCTVTNNGGAINGGTFKDKLTGSGIELGYTLAAEKPTGFESVLVNGYLNSCYVIPNQTYPASVRIVYMFNDFSGFPSLPPLDVAIDHAQHMLLSDWCVSDLKIEFDDIGIRAYEVTFTAPATDGSTVTISPPTRLVIDKDGYPATAQNWDGNRASYTGAGWSYDSSNDTLTLSSGTYDFTSPELNPHGVAVNCPVTVDSNTTITNGIFLKEVTGSALNGVFLNVPTGCENSAKKITVSDNGKITALKMSGEATALNSAANEIYVVGTPTDSTLYVTLSNGKVREVQLPLTADLELQLNDPEPEPEPETYTLKVVGGSFTTGERDALTSGTVPVDAEAKVTLNPDAVPEGMVFDQWTISEESLLGNPKVAYNAESFTIPANAVENGKTVTVEAQYRDATIESEGPGILGTAAMIGTVGISAAVLGYQGYMLGTELYLKYALPSGVSIPANTAELAVLIWNDAGQPAPAAVLEEDATSEQKALTWAVENQLLSADKAADASIGRAEVIRVWNQAQKMK